jgi:hypothetical protein
MKIKAIEELLGVLVALVVFVPILALLVAWPFMWMWNFSVSPTIEGVGERDLGHPASS